MFRKVAIVPLINAVSARQTGRVVRGLLGKMMGRHSRIILVSVANIPIISAVMTRRVVRTTSTMELIKTGYVLMNVHPRVTRAVMGLKVSLGRFAAGGALGGNMRTTLRLADHGVIGIRKIR